MSSTHYETQAELDHDIAAFEQAADVREKLHWAHRICCWALRFHTDSTLHYGRLGIEYAQQLADYEREAEIRLTISQAYFSGGVIQPEGLAETESLLQLTAQHPLSRWHVEALQMKAYFLISYSKLQEADWLLQEAERGIQELFEIDPEWADRLLLQNKYYFATLFQQGVEYNRAVGLAQEGLRMAFAQQKPDLQIGFLQIITWIYGKLGDFENAMHHCQQMLEIGLRFGSTLDLLGINASLGDLARKQGRWAEAENALLEAERCARTLNDPASWRMIYEKRIVLLMEMKRFDEAFVLADALIAKYPQQGEHVEFEYREIYFLQGRILFCQKKYAEATAIWERLRRQFEQDGNTHEHARMLRWMHGAYAEAGDFEQAYRALFQYNALNERFFNEQKAKEFAQFRTQFEAEQRESELRLLKLQQTESELKALKSQMNPHFIFNALNSIQEMFFLGDKRLANKHLSQFSSLMRRILNASSQVWISLEEELAMLRDYLELEAVRFGEDFSYTLEINPEIDPFSAEVPPMLIQPYAENAIKHGLLHREGQRRLEIRLEPHESGRAIWVIVTDNGIGREASAQINARRKRIGKSFASDATKKRLELLLQQTHTGDAVRYDDLQPGTRVTILIPLASE